MRNVSNKKSAQPNPRTQQPNQHPAEEHAPPIGTLHHRSVTRSGVKPATNSPINFFAPEKTAQSSNDHTAHPLDDHTISYRANKDISDSSSTTQDTQRRSKFVTKLDQQNKTQPSKWLHLLLQRDSESPTWLTKLHRESSGVFKLQLFSRLPPPSEPVPCRISLSVGLPG